MKRSFYKPVTQKRGDFITSKFDQFKRNIIPYCAVVEAFKTLVSSNLCFQYGVVCESAMSYSYYATILIATAGDYQSAYELGLVATIYMDIKQEMNV